MARRTDSIFKKKDKLPPPPPPPDIVVEDPPTPPPKVDPSQTQVSRTALRQQESQVVQKEHDEMGSRMDAFFSGTDGRHLATGSEDAVPAAQPTAASPDAPPVVQSATVVGGKGEPEPAPSAKAPVIESTPLPPATIESMEDLETRLESYQPPPGKAEDKRNFLGIKDAIRSEHKLALEMNQRALAAEAELAELKKQVPSEQEKTDNAMYRKIVNTHLVKTLPKWAEYDKAVDEIEKGVVDFLTKAGVTEQVLNAIKDRGGVVKFSNSQESAGRNFKNPNGSQMTQAQWWEKHVLEANNMTQQDKMKLAQMIGKATDKLDEKARDLKLAEEDGQRTLDTERDNFLNESNQVMANVVGEWVKKELPRFEYPMAKPVISANDPAEVKKQKETDIKDWEAGDKMVVDVGSSLIRGPIQPKYAGEWAAIIGFYPYLAKKAESLLKANKELSAKVDDLQKFKDGITTARKLPKGSPETKKEEKVIDYNTSAADRVAAAFPGR